MKEWKATFVCLFIWVGLAVPGTASASTPGIFLFLSSTEAASLRALLRAPGSPLSAFAEALRREADSAMKKGPWSVTNHRPKNIPGITTHDFFSEGPYWWPDPANPAGPYIRRDGEVNPDRFVENDRDMNEMSQAVLTLGTAAYFLEKKSYAEHASLILKTWFLDPQTAMSPHLEFGQAIRGINYGRGTGIIDTNNLIWAIQGIAFLENTAWGNPEERAGLQQWFSQYAHWMSESAKGLDEKKSGNNHSTWWTAQLAAYAIFSGEKQLEALVWDYYRTFLVPTQIRLDGSCPREEARTKSLGYSSMNLNGFALLCRLAQIRGVELWHFAAKDNGSVAKAIAYLAPFVAQPATWKKPQIAPYHSSGAYFLGLAGLGLGEPQYLSLYKKLATRDDTWSWLLSALLQSKELRDGRSPG